MWPDDSVCTCRYLDLLPRPHRQAGKVQHYFPKLQKKRPESRNDQSKQGPFHRQACPQWNVWKIWKSTSSEHVIQTTFDFELIKGRIHSKHSLQQWGSRFVGEDQEGGKEGFGDWWRCGWRGRMRWRRWRRRRWEIGGRWRGETITLCCCGRDIPLPAKQWHSTFASLGFISNYLPHGWDQMRELPANVFCLETFERNIPVKIL